MKKSKRGKVAQAPTVEPLTGWAETQRMAADVVAEAMGVPKPELVRQAYKVEPLVLRMGGVDYPMEQSRVMVGHDLDDGVQRYPAPFHTSARPEAEKAERTLTSTRDAGIYTEDARGPVPDALHLDPLWTSRLSAMAEAANQTPRQYLETLVRRAWVAMPSGKRVGL